MPNVMAGPRNIDGALCDSSIIPFLETQRRVWLTPTTRVPCCNAANIGEHKTWMKSEFCTWQNSVRARAPENVYIYSVSAKETAKHREQFGWRPVSDVAAVTKARRETR